MWGQPLTRAAPDAVFELKGADDSLRTLPVGLSEFVVSDFAFWGQLMAAAALASAPVVLVYIYLHKYMVSGLTAGAVKG